MWTQNCSKNVIPNFGEGIGIQREYKIDSSFHASAKSRENGTMGQSLVDWTVAFLILQLEEKARMWKNKVMKAGLTPPEELSEALVPYRKPPSALLL